MKTSELTGAALDWAVAKCEGIYFENLKDFEMYAGDYSTDWSQGGPIIYRERIAIDFDADPTEGGPCAASRRDDPCYWVGPTPLIAAMRCYVSSKLGDEVDVPAELTGELK